MNAGGVWIGGAAGKGCEKSRQDCKGVWYPEGICLMGVSSDVFFLLLASEYGKGKEGTPGRG